MVRAQPFGIAASYAIISGFLAFNGLTNDDEGVVLTSARLIREGKIPYFDFAVSKQPLSLFYHAIWPELIPGRLMNTAIGTVATFFLALKVGRWSLFSLLPPFVYGMTLVKTETLSYGLAVAFLYRGHWSIVALSIINRATTVYYLPLLWFQGRRREVQYFIIGGAIVFFIAMVLARPIFVDNVIYNALVRRHPSTYVLDFLQVYPLLFVPAISQRFREIGLAFLFGSVALNWGFVAPGNIERMREVSSHVEEPVFTMQNLMYVIGGFEMMTDRQTMGRFAGMLDDPRYLIHPHQQAFIDRANTVAGYSYEFDNWDMSGFERVKVIEDYGQPQERFEIWARK